MLGGASRFPSRSDIYRTTTNFFLLLYVSSYYYICVRIDSTRCRTSKLYMCPYTTIYVSSYDYICVLILGYMSSRTATCVLIILLYYICVLILLCHTCPHTTIVLYICPHTTIVLYMCLHTRHRYYTTLDLAVVVFRPHTTIYVSSYYYVCVLILFMCPHTTIRIGITRC